MEAKFLIKRICDQVREETNCTGVVKTVDDKLFFEFKDSDDSTYLVEVLPSIVTLRKNHNSNYTIHFNKDKQNGSFFLLENFKRVEFTTEKILIKRDEKSYDLYISHNLFGQNQSIRIKCEIAI